MSRNASLDVLRGIAILLVMFHHYPYLSFVGNMGWSGVDLFFVLSGFLISGLLFQELRSAGTIHIWRFLVRRGFKIYPPFYFFLAVTALISPYVRHHYFWIEASFLQSIFIPKGTVVLHTWSLAVEEHFYIALPILLWVLRKHLSHLWTIFGLIAVSCLVLRIWYCANTRLPVAWNDLRFDALFVGVILGYLFHYRHDTFLRWNRWFLLPAGCVFLLPVCLLPQTTPLRVSLTMSSNAFGYAFVLAWAITRELPYARWLGDIGKYSYSIYLWHAVLARAFPPPTLLLFAAYLLVSISVGITMAVLIETPALALRGRIMQRSLHGSSVNSPLALLSRKSVRSVRVRS